MVATTKGKTGHTESGSPYISSLPAFCFNCFLNLLPSVFNFVSPNKSSKSSSEASLSICGLSPTFALANRNSFLSRSYPSAGFPRINTHLLYLCILFFFFITIKGVIILVILEILIRIVIQLFVQATFQSLSSATNGTIRPTRSTFRPSRRESSSNRSTRTFGLTSFVARIRCSILIARLSCSS